LDIIINNAGIASIDSSLEKAQEMFLTNYYGVKFVNEYLIPLLRDNGRVVNVASESGASTLNRVSKDLQNKYTDSKYVENVNENT
jgi:carbonyl reductase 1